MFIRIIVWVNALRIGKVIKVEKILKGRLDLIPSPSSLVKIQIMSGKVCLKCKGKTLLDIVNKHFKTKSLLTYVLAYYQVNYPAYNLNFY